jgi:hypothetical protein
MIFVRSARNNVGLTGRHTGLLIVTKTLASSDLLIITYPPFVCTRSSRRYSETCANRKGFLFVENPESPALVFSGGLFPESGL